MPSRRGLETSYASGLEEHDVSASLVFPDMTQRHRQRTGGGGFKLPRGRQTTLGRGYPVFLGCLGRNRVSRSLWEARFQLDPLVCSVRFQRALISCSYRSA